MTQHQLKSPDHDKVRAAFRLWGPIVAGVGLVFTIIGMGSFFSSFGSFETPRLFWCAFVGLPLMGVGLILCKFGYLGAIYRYVATEAAPVASDAFNEVSKGIQPGLRSVAKAVIEGIKEGQSEEKSSD